MLLERVLLIGSIVWTLAFAQHRQYYGGVVVPGRSVPSLRFFEFYISACKNPKSKEFSLEKLTNMLKEVDADSIADKVYRELYFMIDDLDVEQMMGTWHAVIDSPGLHPERCVVSKFELLAKNEYSATFSTIQHASEKFGVDPGNIFIYTGQPNDICPYFPTKVGPLNLKANQFEYMVLTQALKHPTVVLARNPREFEERYKTEVMDYLKRSDFINPISALNYPLQVVNTTTCSNAHQLYYNPDNL
ncbi:hypothetical protein M3Y97_00367100 [Aphelenchoides bicaudatus]|nr:hypothetical protein M3Y97_00367100 [Aphelenchoides bicaudatus]